MSREDEAREAVEKAFQVAQMQEHPGWAVLTAYVRAELDKRLSAIVEGQMKSLDQYREYVGWVQAARFCLNAQKELEATATRLRGS